MTPPLGWGGTLVPYRADWAFKDHGGKACLGIRARGYWANLCLSSFLICEIRRTTLTAKTLAHTWKAGPHCQLRLLLLPVSLSVHRIVFFLSQEVMRKQPAGTLRRAWLTTWSPSNNSGLSLSYLNLSISSVLVSLHAAFPPDVW